MKNLAITFSLLAFLFSCNAPQEEATDKQSEVNEEFKFLAEQFADLKIIRYQIPGFEKLSLDQKKLVYYLTQAGLSGRDIMYDQNYRHNLSIRKAFENIYKTYSGDKASADWKAFEVYRKRVWFSNGIHHHYGSQKFNPEFSREYLESLLSATETNLESEILEILFDPEAD